MQLLQAEIYAELGEIISGKKPAPVDKITVFDSLGEEHASQSDDKQELRHIGEGWHWFLSFVLRERIKSFFHISGLAMEDVVSAKIVYEKFMASKK